MKKLLLILLVIIGVISFVTLTYAAVPRVINYQGKFTDKSNNPLDGNYLVTFRFYEVASEGEPLWEEGHILTLKSGMFNALLGSIKPLDIDFDRDLWLGIEVASDGEMSPRIKLASSAYALNAQAIDMLDSSQLMRNDIDSVMSGSLTLRKDLILKGDIAEPSRIVLTDANGREYYLWMDNSGNLRIKQGLPSSGKDGAILATEKPNSISSSIRTPLLLLVGIGVIFYLLKKKK
ncbi:MAG: hypothetical protein KJ957_03825 [Candidatus Omnitrophica bacterium]|nr:hypothetical protein [Candidatus Omnitrophota bacterium]